LKDLQYSWISKARLKITALPGNVFLPDDIGLFLQAHGQWAEGIILTADGRLCVASLNLATLITLSEEDPIDGLRSFASFVLRHADMLDRCRPTDLAKLPTVAAILPASIGAGAAESNVIPLFSKEGSPDHA
jgi:hypothetical protein